jgi:hypothetical protein
MVLGRRRGGRGRGPVLWILFAPHVWWCILCFGLLGAAIGIVRAQDGRAPPQSDGYLEEALRVMARGLHERARELSGIEPLTTNAIGLAPSALGDAEELRRLFDPHPLGAPNIFAAPAPRPEPLIPPQAPMVVLSRRG